MSSPTPGEASSLGSGEPRMSEELLGEREKEVLRAVVQEYIATGGPVGSQQLARRAEFDVSSATLRNVLADLEELGFLEKPHTSAGRVPTDRGYRFYVDTLVRLKDPRRGTGSSSTQGLAHEAGMEELLAEASRVLHSLTRHAGVVLTPARRPRSSSSGSSSSGCARTGCWRSWSGRTARCTTSCSRWTSPSPPRSWSRRPTTSPSCCARCRWRRCASASARSWTRSRRSYNELAAKALKLGAAATDLQTSGAGAHRGHGLVPGAARVRRRGADARALPGAGGEAQAARAAGPGAARRARCRSSSAPRASSPRPVT